MEFPKPSWLLVAVSMLPVRQMPSVEEGRSHEAELHRWLNVATRIHFGMLQGHYNRHARPFLWTATADSILGTIERLCTVINGTQH
jgi:hypothetical protein